VLSGYERSGEAAYAAANEVIIAEAQKHCAGGRRTSPRRSSGLGGICKIGKRCNCPIRQIGREGWL
jgi:hypothetical protein